MDQHGSGVDTPVSDVPPPPPPPESTYHWGPAPDNRRPRSLVASAFIAVTLVVAAAVAVPLLLIGRNTHTNSSGSGSGSKPSPTASSSPQARALYQQAIAATRAAPGFHYVAVTSGGVASQKIVGDAGQNTGTQAITFSASYGTEQFTLYLVSGTVYFQGNVPALEDQLGVPTNSASKYDGRWISIASGDGPYTVVAPGITTGDQADEIPLVANATSHVTTSGTSATRISGTVPPVRGAPSGTGYLDIDATSHAPIQYVSTVSANGVTLKDTVTFSAWGPAPSVSAPTGAIAWSTLGASEPPGGYGNGGIGGPSNQTPIPL
jgi:hypothetical protein